MKIDYDRVAVLLNIVKDISTATPMYMAISGVAMAELKDLNEAIAKEAVAGKAPPTDPLAPPPAPEPAQDGIPTNELGAEPPRVESDEPLVERRELV